MPPPDVEAGILHAPSAEAKADGTMIPRLAAFSQAATGGAGMVASYCRRGCGLFVLPVNHEPAAEKLNGAKDHIVIRFQASC